MRKLRWIARRSRWTLFVISALLAGCDSSKLDLPPPPPHGGTPFALPGGKGFVEVLRQDAPAQPGQTQLIVYFLDPQCKPLPSAPTAVSFKPKDRGASPVALKPIGDADPSKAGGLASTPFRDSGEVVGLLSAQIENKPVSVAVNMR